MKMQDFGAMIAGNSGEATSYFKAAVVSVCVNAKRNIRQVKETPYLFCWFRKKVERTVPPARAKLQRQLARESLGATDAARLNSDYGN